MSAANQYRAVRLALLDDPRFQSLPSPARFVYIALTVLLGPAGIEVRYPEPLAFELAPRTGLSPRKVLTCLRQLEAAGWIRREASVLWVVHQLRSDPVLNPNVPNHKKSVRNYVRGLPDCALVREFKQVHRDPWLGEEAELSPPDGMGYDIPDAMSYDIPDAMSGGPGMPRASAINETEERRPRTGGARTEDGEPEERGSETETEKATSVGDGAGAPPEISSANPHGRPAPVGAGQVEAVDEKRRRILAGIRGGVK